ncbi:MAG: hypothetical protein AAGN15_26935 [Cyanobacteria bacterium J06581_3]
MYKIECADDKTRSMIKDRNTFWDPELGKEFSPVLKQLRRTGEIAGASCGFRPGVAGLIYEIKGKTFKLDYTVNSEKKIIRIYEFRQVFHHIDWQTALERDCQRSEEESVYIPQIGDPHLFLKAITLISKGTNTPKGIGIALGSTAKKEKDQARKGDYAGRALMAFGLVERVHHKEDGHSVYALTKKGALLSASKDQETRERLLAEALLGFYPIQIIVSATRQGEKPLTKELIQEAIAEVTLGDCGGTTSPRRASSLRALVNWVTRWAGIAIQRGDSSGIQLYIPNIYADKKSQHL